MKCALARSLLVLDGLGVVGLVYWKASGTISSNVSITDGAILLLTQNYTMGTSF